MKWDNKKHTMIMAVALSLLPIKTFPTKGLFESPSWLSPAITYGSYLATASILSYSAWQKLQQHFLSDTPHEMAQSKHTKHVTVHVAVTDTEFQQNILTLLDEQKTIPLELLASIENNTPVSKGLIRQLQAYNAQLNTEKLKAEHNVSLSNTTREIAQGIKKSFEAINK